MNLNRGDLHHGQKNHRNPAKSKNPVPVLQRIIYRTNKPKINTRRVEHKNAVLKKERTSSLAQHVKATGYTIDFENIKIIANKDTKQGKPAHDMETDHQTHTRKTNKSTNYSGNNRIGHAQPGHQSALYTKQYK